MQVVKQRFARLVLHRKRRSPAQAELWPEQPHVWQHRFYDFNVWTERKRIEKLRYMHRNPVKRGLVLEPAQWEWSSYRSYAYREQGKVKTKSVAEGSGENPRGRLSQNLTDQQSESPILCKKRKGWTTLIVC